MLIHPKADAADWKLLDVEEVSVDAYKIGFYRNPYWQEYEREIDRGFNLNLHFSFMRVGFYEGQFAMTGTEAQLRQGGLQFRTGVHVTKYLDFCYWHYSDHLLDASPVREEDHFPIQDSYGIRLIIFKRGS